MSSPTTRAVGLEWEEFAAAFLRNAGLHILAQRYTCRLGEIDLIADDGETLVFVEVRFRGNDICGRAAASVTRAKQRRILRAANHFIMCHSAFAERPMRIDVFAIDASKGRRDRPPQTEWIRGAISAD